MSLVNQVAWVVGGVGVVGRGITRGLLQAGATVIVNSRSEERLEHLAKSLDDPDRLHLVHGSLLPGAAPQTVQEMLRNLPLHHVVSHGAVRWWARPDPSNTDACDESYSLNISGTARLLDKSPQDFVMSSAQLAGLHFSAAKELVPHLLKQEKSSYTFVTGDGSGKPGGNRTSMAEVNSYHVWGLSAAMRRELADTSVMCREIRVGLPINPSGAELKANPLLRSVSEYIGDLCAGLANAHSKSNDQGRLIDLQELEQLQEALDEYNVDVDERVGPLPTYICDAGVFSGSL